MGFKYLIKRAVELSHTQKKTFFIKTKTQELLPPTSLEWKSPSLISYQAQRASNSLRKQSAV